jgi:Ca2+-binding RTX toxin-like protein
MVKVTTAQSTQARINSLTATREVTTSYTAVEPLLAGPMDDARVFNAAFDWEVATGLPKHTQDLVGTTIRGNPVLQHGANVPGTVRWQLDSGMQQDTSDGIITYGFASTRHALGLNNHPGFGEGRGYTPFTDAQKAAARISIANWDDLISAKFVEVPQGPGASAYGKQTTDIMLANTFSGPAQAWAYYPGYGNQYKRVAGDVWIADPRFNGSNAQLEPGQYGLQTLNHELGHALGLSHPGEYNFGDDQDGDGVADPITYEGDAFYFQDSNQYSIMSYFDSYETGAQPVDWNLMRFVYPSTPMIDDVFVIQQKYGADMTTRTGNTTYGFNATDDVKNDAMRFDAGEMATVFTIWDAGGDEDTLDLSGFYTPSIIDLREGAFSSAGGFGAYNPAQAALNVDALTKEQYLAYVNAANVAEGLAVRTAAYDLYFGGRTGVNEGIAWNLITDSVGKYLMEQNIGIAYGTIIENAIGGAGNDRINGNQAQNDFRGNGGADTFIIADYSDLSVPDPTDKADWSKVVIDNSIDRILDFNRAEGDKIDLTAFGVKADALSYVAVTGGMQVTVERGDHDVTFIVLGDLVTPTDFLF